MQDWAGWLLVLFSFSIVLMWKHVRSDTKVVHAIWFCLVFHHAVAYLNVYVPDVSNSFNLYIPDASAFHGDGANLASLPEADWKVKRAPTHPSTPDLYNVYDKGNISGSRIYVRFLGVFYRVFGSSHLLGKELSVLAFALSCVILVKLVDYLDLRRFRVSIVLLYGLLPSVVIFMSVTLRESWQALFFLLTVYWAIRLWKQPGILKVSLLLISASCLAFTHHGLTKFAVYLVVLSVFWALLSRKKNVRWARHLRFMFAGLLIAGVIIFAKNTGYFMTVEQALEGAKGFRQALLVYDVRTAYSFMLDTSSVHGLVTTIHMVFVEYMFAPFPWQVENVKDIYALLESTLRLLFLFFALSSWYRSSGEVRSYYGFLLIAVLGMELMWALGTVNWGTAARHHVVGYSVIVLLGAPRLILFMRKLHLEMFGRGKVSGELNEQVRHMS
jgi:hypothetical protein